VEVVVGSDDVLQICRQTAAAERFVETEVRLAHDVPEIGLVPHDRVEVFSDRADHLGIQLHRVGAEREFGTSLQTLDELPQCVTEDAGAIVVDHDRDAKRHRGHVGTDDLAILASFFDDEVVSAEIGDRNTGSVDNADENRAGDPFVKGRLVGQTGTG